MIKAKFIVYFTDAENEEKANNSIDDGGPLEVSALSMKDDGDDDDDEREEDDDDDDDEMPPKITMEDLAGDLDSTEEKNDQGADSPEMKFEELTPRENLAPVKDVTEASDGNRKEGKSVEHSKLPEDSSMEVDDIGSNLAEERSKSNGYGNGHSKLRKDNLSDYHASASQRNWQTRYYSATESYYKYSHLSELDEDVILMRAKAALRRANQFSPPKDISSYPHRLALSDLSLNVSSAWEPVRMSTPVVPQASASLNYRSHADYDSRYSYKSISRSHGHDIADGVYNEESGLGRSSGERTSRHHGVSGRRLSPAVEDIIRRRKLQGYPEGN